MSSVLLLVAVFGPFVGSLVALARPGLTSSGRAVTAGAASATVAAVVLLVISAARSTGEIVGLGPLELTLGRSGSLLLTLVAATATVVSGFSVRSLDDDGRPARYFSLIGLVATGSAMVVVPGNPVLLVIGWLVSGWALVGLVGFEPDWEPARRARRRIGGTLLVGDVALVLAVIAAVTSSDGLLAGDGAGATAQLRDESILGVGAVHVVAVLVVIAGASRSAMVPFHRWLIETLAGPTPVSALVHAGLVSGAGLLLLRFIGPFVASDTAVLLAFILAVITVVIASTAGVLRSDVKGGLAWSTVAQMAFMVIQCAVGAFSSAVFHIVGHGMYKAALFLGAGDTASSGLMAKRRPVPEQLLAGPTRVALSVAIPTVAVGSAVLAIPPAVSDGGRVLVVVFAWLTIAFGTAGWLGRGPLGPLPTAATAFGAGLVTAFVYVGGLRLVEEFLKPSLGQAPIETVIGPLEIMIVLGFLGLGVAAANVPGAVGAEIRRRWFRLVMAATARRAVGGPAAAKDAATARTSPPPKRTTSIRQRAEIRADVALASSIIAPQWPLASFVAVNPLGGVESAGFDSAAATGRRWLGGRTHLSLAEFRLDHRDSVTEHEDLIAVANRRLAQIGRNEPIPVEGRLLNPVEVIVADLLNGPESTAPPRPSTALQRTVGDHGALAELINRTLSSWLAWYMEPPKWAPFGPQDGFVPMSRRLLMEDPSLSLLHRRPVLEWVTGLEADPAAMIDAAFAVLGVDESDRPDELRAQLCQLPGWAGLAKWRNEWAQPDEQRPAIAPIEVIAVRATMDAMAVLAGAGPDRDATPAAPGPGAETADLEQADRALLAQRVDAVSEALGLSSADATVRHTVTAILAAVPPEDRASLWLEAQQRRFEATLLSTLSTIDRSGNAETSNEPDVQMVFCIDVRSEGLRRQIEAVGPVETIGFAGFFGVPMRVRRLGWDHSEARCPVLVAPAIEATERPRTDKIGAVASDLSRRRSLAAVNAAHSAAKAGPGAPFALAETAGWFLGPAAAIRTFRPPEATRPDRPETIMVLDDDEILLEQRVFFAEAVLNTMGLTERFAPLVLLCGHTSRTTNNPHATALECGACAGAAGDDNARAVAALLNSADVRNGLVGRGIDIPDETWFMAGVHDTASDDVMLLDVDDVPAGYEPKVTAIQEVLDEAGRRQADRRAASLPGSAARVRHRGADWAQVRPEWGLAGNAAFIIGPRALTEGLDLEGRAFLHNYDSALDPTGRVLETIMTAPLVVGHWISAQYYFSTVDPEVFGAGNKLLHNPIGTTGVFSGDGGDLRVGLPLQSTTVDGRRFHQPLRLLAVIEADRQRIDAIVAAAPILQSLTGGSWLRITARSGPDEPWHSRTPDGAWVLGPDVPEPESTMTVERKTI